MRLKRSTFASRLKYQVSSRISFLEGEYEGGNTFGIDIPGIKRNTIFLRHSWVESALHVIDGLWDEVET
jgi:hypothetical protein